MPGLLLIGYFGPLSQRRGLHVGFTTHNTTRQKIQFPIERSSSQPLHSLYQRWVRNAFSLAGIRVQYGHVIQNRRKHV